MIFNLQLIGARTKSPTPKPPLPLITLAKSTTAVFYENIPLPQSFIDFLAMRRSSRRRGRPGALGGLQRTACSGSGRFPHQTHSQAKPCRSTVPSAPSRRKPHVVARVLIDLLVASRSPSTRGEGTPRPGGRADTMPARRESRSRRFGRGSALAPSRTGSIPPATPSSEARRDSSFCTAFGWPCSSSSPSAARGDRGWPHGSSCSQGSLAGWALRPRAVSAPRPS